MKNLVIILILFITIVLLAPKFIGGVVETEHQSIVDKLSENPAITIETTTFTRRWFGGKAVTEMTILLPEEEVEELTIIIEENLLFGPIIFTDDGFEFALSLSQASINFEEFQLDKEVVEFINNKLHVSALLTFSKKVVTKIVIDEISEEIDGNKVTSAKATGDFTLENNNRIYGQFLWNGLTVTKNEESFSIEKVDFSIDQTLVAGDFYQGNTISSGDFNLSVASIKAKNSSAITVLSLDKVLMNAMSAVNDDLLTIAMTYKVDKLLSKDQKLAHANLDIVLNGLNINVMKEINSFMQEFPVDSEDFLNPENMQKLSLLTARFLADEPTMAIKDLSVQTPEGKVKSSMQMSIDKKLFDSTNMMSIIPAVKADADGIAPTLFFTKLGLASLVDAYVQQGFIIQKEDELSFKVEFTQGQLTVNGKIMPM